MDIFSHYFLNTTSLSFKSSAKRRTAHRDACPTVLTLSLYASGTACTCVHGGGATFFTTMIGACSGNVRDHASLSTLGVWAPRCPLAGSVTQVLSDRWSASPAHFGNHSLPNTHLQFRRDRTPRVFPHVLRAQQEVHGCYLHGVSGGGGGGCRSAPKHIAEGGVCARKQLCHTYDVSFKQARHNVSHSTLRTNTHHSCSSNRQRARSNCAHTWVFVCRVCQKKEPTTQT